MNVQRHLVRQLLNTVKRHLTVKSRTIVKNNTNTIWRIIEILFYRVTIKNSESESFWAMNHNATTLERVRYILTQMRFGCVCIANRSNNTTLLTQTDYFDIPLYQNWTNTTNNEEIGTFEHPIVCIEEHSPQFSENLLDYGQRRVVKVQVFIHDPAILN